MLTRPPKQDKPEKTPAMLFDSGSTIMSSWVYVVTSCIRAMHRKIKKLGFIKTINPKPKGQAYTPLISTAAFPLMAGDEKFHHIFLSIHFSFPRRTVILKWCL